MKKTDKNYYLELMNDKEEKILSIPYCIDSIEVRARVTFDSYEFEGVRVTYWTDDTPIKDIENRINSIFDILFNEMIKNRGINQSAVVKS